MNVLDTMKRLSDSFGVVGDVSEVGKIACELLSPYIDAVEVDSFANVIGRKACGIPSAPKVLLNAHIDQPGFLVTQIEENGFLRFLEMGVDRWPMPGSELRIRTRDGEIRTGIVAAPPSQPQSSPPAISDLFVDTGMTQQHARECFHIGDYMTHAGTAFELQEGILCGSGMDNRAGFAGILYALTLLQSKTLHFDLIVAAGAGKTAGRDIAWREGPAYAVSIGTCNAKTCDSGSETAIRMGAGPVVAIGSNSLPFLARSMLKAGGAANIPHQVMAVGGQTGSSAWEIQTVGCGIPTLIVSVPVKYRHAPMEVIEISDILHTGMLVSEFLARFTEDCQR